VQEQSQISYESRQNPTSTHHHHYHTVATVGRRGMNPSNDNATKMNVNQVAQEGLLVPPPSPSLSESMATNKQNNDNQDEADDYTFWERQSVRVANRPCTYFWISFLLPFGLGMIGLFLGDFSVAVDNDGKVVEHSLPIVKHNTC
jgi:hypothetical protein